MIAVPVIVVLLGCGAYLRRDKERGVMTPDRIKIFNAAISGGMQDPDNLEKLAKVFSSQGLTEQAALLRQRANLKRLPNEIKLARRTIWRRAIKSKNKAAMMKLAAAYDSEGCTSAAMRLREIASGIPDVLPQAESTVSGESRSETDVRGEADTADDEEMPTEPTDEDRGIEEAAE